jgi:hypothetical protein
MRLARTLLHVGTRGLLARVARERARARDDREVHRRRSRRRLCRPGRTSPSGTPSCASRSGIAGAPPWVRGPRSTLAGGQGQVRARRRGAGRPRPRISRGYIPAHAVQEGYGGFHAKLGHRRSHDGRHRACGCSPDGARTADTWLRAARWRLEAAQPAVGSGAGGVSAPNRGEHSHGGQPDKRGPADRLEGDQDIEVPGNTVPGDVAQSVRALACHARGRGFKSRRSRRRRRVGYCRAGRAGWTLSGARRAAWSRPCSRCASPVLRRLCSTSGSASRGLCRRWCPTGHRP